MFGSLHGASLAAALAVAGVGQVRSPILAGTASDVSQDSVVMLVFSDPAANLRGICTAALVAPRLVLTARHCVSQTDADVACSVDGQAASGGAVRANHDPRKLYVFTGSTRPDLDPATWRPAGRGVEIVDDGSTNLCNHDLALVVLEQPVTGVPLAPLRLDGDVRKDEMLTTVGWGVTSSADEPGTRQQRSGVRVTRVGPDDEAPVLTPNELAFDESICLGDSGGPVLSASTKAVVAVVSRGGNGRASSGSLAATCTEATNLGTKLSPFKALVLRAFERAGAQPLLEPAESEEDGGCSTVRTGARGDGGSREALALVAVLGLVLGARRARRRRAPLTRP